MHTRRALPVPVDRGDVMSPTNPISTQRKLFLTGASGVVGRALLKRLPADEVICLTHRAPVSLPGVETVRGNIREDRLCLAEDSFSALAGRIGCIVHAAAVTKFSQSAKNIFAANVDGTRQVLELAQAAGVPLYFVSTAYVHPVRHIADTVVSNSYEESKLSAEDIVLSSGHPATIVRPSIVVGDSRTGEIERFQGFHLILELALRRRVPWLPGAADGYIDFIPQDVVADIILSLVRAGVVNREFWLTAGARAPRLQHLLGLAVANASHMFGQPIAMPRLMRPDVFERDLRSKLLTAEPAAKRIANKQLSHYVKYLSIVEPLPTSLPNLPYDPDQTFASNVQYWYAHTGQAEFAAA